MLAKRNPGGTSIQAPSSQRGRGCRQFAWIDSYSLSRDCILRGLSDLQPDIEISSFANIEDCLSWRGPPFDLIILHWHVSYESCLEVISELRANFVDSLIVILWSLEGRDNADMMRGALRAGANGLISTKSTGLAMALMAIRFVQAGGTFAPLEMLMSEPSSALADEPAESSFLGFTSRQRAVTALLQQGKPNKIIALELGMSESTAKIHVRNIMLKMGVTNRTQAAFKALKLSRDSQAVHDE